MRLAWTRPLAGAALGLCVLTVPGCGSETSVKEFCKAGDQFARANEFDEGVRAARRLDETGKPDGMPANAREGFQVVVDLVTGAEDQAALEKAYTALTDEERDAVAALDSYIEKSC